MGDGTQSWVWLGVVGTSTGCTAGEGRCLAEDALLGRSGFEPSLPILSGVGECESAGFSCGVGAMRWEVAEMRPATLSMEAEGGAAVALVLDRAWMESRRRGSRRL